MNTQKWEYNVLSEDGYVGWLELNELGKDGWELVACMNIQNDYHPYKQYIFKRPK
jgi:hypothetical protein